MYFNITRRRNAKRCNYHRPAITVAQLRQRSGNYGDTQAASDRWNSVVKRKVRNFGVVLAGLRFGFMDTTSELLHEPVVKPVVPARIFPKIYEETEQVLINICEVFDLNKRELACAVCNAYVNRCLSWDIIPRFRDPKTFCKHLYRQSDKFFGYSSHGESYIFGLKLKNCDVARETDEPHSGDVAAVRIFPEIYEETERALLDICVAFDPDKRELARNVYNAYANRCSSWGMILRFRNSKTFCKHLYRQSDKFLGYSSHGESYICGLKLGSRDETPAVAAQASPSTENDRKLGCGNFRDLNVSAAHLPRAAAGLQKFPNAYHNHCCGAPGCKTLACFNFKTQKASFCFQHKTDDMINVKAKRCEFLGCEKRARFNRKGKTPKFCADHKHENMVNAVQRTCKTPFCDTIVSKKYDGYCLRCYIHTFPDRPVSHNYKTKERAVAEFLQSAFPDKSLIIDKRVNDGFSLRRPDVFLDMATHVVIVETDENQHVCYDCSCENKRLCELWLDVGKRPLVFLRFNPDGYYDATGSKVSTCWGCNARGIAVIGKSKGAEWQHRLDSLKEMVGYWTTNVPEKSIEVIQLFYDETVVELPQSQTAGIF